MTDALSQPLVDLAETWNALFGTEWEPGFTWSNPITFTRRRKGGIWVLFVYEVFGKSDKMRLGRFVCPTETIRKQYEVFILDLYRRIQLLQLAER